MESIKLLEDINKIQIDNKYDKKSYSEIFDILNNKNTQDCFIEVAFAAEIGLLALFKERNIPDNLFEAYKASFTQSDISLYEHYTNILEKGDDAVRGFISNLKGKFFEFELPDKLREIYPEFDFNIASNPIQPIWDIHAVNADGSEEILIQAKMWLENSWSKLADIMESNEDIMYATSSEIREKIIEKVPELSEQFIPIDISNYEFTENVKENLEVLTDNLGIDVPDEIGDILPYVSEIVLGIRLILDLISVQRDFKNISSTDKAKLSAVKVIVLFARYGVTAVCSSICSAAGTLITGLLGTASGALVGAVLSSKINKEIKPYMLDIALNLVGLNDEDIFYYNNKKKIDNLALSYNTIEIY